MEDLINDVLATMAYVGNGTFVARVPNSLDINVRDMLITRALADPKVKAVVVWEGTRPSRLRFVATNVTGIDLREVFGCTDIFEVLSGSPDRVAVVVNAPMGNLLYNIMLGLRKAGVLAA